MSKRLQSFLYHPLTNGRDGEEEDDLTGRERYLLDVSFRTLAIGTASLPLVGFSFCLFWSLFVMFEQTVSTHCNVPNLLPSLSAATGAFYPQKLVWKVTIAIHTVPRVIVFAVYYYRHHCLPIFVLNLVEVFSLLGLSLFGSNDNYPIHSRCFGAFLISSLLYMFVVSYTDIYSWCRRTQKIKRIISWMTLTLILLAAYTFARHNQHCEPYVYTVFSLSEYVIVLSNIYFHTLAYYDLSSVHFAILSDDEHHRKDDHRNANHFSDDTSTVTCLDIA